MKFLKRIHNARILRVMINISLLTFFSASIDAFADSCPDIVTLGATRTDATWATSNTKIINDGLESYGCVTIPKGVFWISVSAGGIVVSSGNTIKGINSESSMLVAADRAPGAIIKRRVPTNRGDYVSGVKIQDIGVVLNHDEYNTQNPEMIGIDFSHISGSYISNVYVGNAPWGEATKVLAPPLKKHQVQGIGIKLCTYGSATDTLYSGGERNVIDKARVWGARIGISIDDTRCVDSAANATIVRDSEISTVEYGIAQQSKHTAGVILSGNHIQDFVAGGDNSSTMLSAYVIMGYANEIHGGYIEGSSNNLLKVLYLGDAAHGIKADLGYVSLNTSTPLVQMIRMAGYKNQISGYDIFTNDWINLRN